MKTKSIASFVLGALLVGSLPLHAQVITVGPPVVDRDYVDFAYQITYLDPGYQVTLPGTVTSWSLWAKGTGPLSLQVYRPVTEGYQLIGQNPVSIAAPGLNTFPIASEDQIHVQPGDVIGFRDNTTTAENKIIAYSASAGTEIWTDWPDGGAHNVGIGGILGTSLFYTAETRTYSLAATVTAVPEPHSGLVVGVLMLGGLAAQRIRRSRS